MNMFMLVWTGIWRKRGRSVLTFCSIIVAFVLFGLLLGFSESLDSTIAKTHGDVLLTFSRASQLEPLPIAQLSQIEKVPGVMAVTPVILFRGSYRTTLNRVQAYAVEPIAFAKADPDLKISESLIEALKKKRAGALVPSRLSESLGWKVGDRIPLRSLLWTNIDGSRIWPLDIVGIYASNPDDLLYGNAVLVNYDYIDQTRTNYRETASNYLLRVSDPKRVSQVAAAIDAKFVNSFHETKTASEAQLAQDSITSIGDIGLLVNAVVGAVFFSLLFSVGAVMLQSVNERLSELAVLKTIGFSNMTILVLILLETFLFCQFAAAAGLALSAALFPIAEHWTRFELNAKPILLIGFAFASLLGILSGLPPAIRAMRLQIVDALAKH